MKRCGCCGIEKPLTEFHKRGDGHQSYCKLCKIDHYNTNRESYDKAFRKYNYKNAYGIKIEDYEKIFSEQGGLCKICGREQGSAGVRRLAVDHCHDTGIVRGLLCSNCNTGLGKLGDTVEGLMRAVNYIQGFKCQA